MPRKPTKRNTTPKAKRNTTHTAGRHPNTKQKPDTAAIPVGVTCADNLPFMRSLPDGCCDMIYADPPFFTGRRRTQTTGRHAYGDHWPGGLAQYADFLLPRLREMHRLLAETGTFFLHLDWHAVHYAKVALDEIFGYRNFLNEIIWSYRTGGVPKRWFGRKHDTILSYAKSRGNHTFTVQRAGAFRTDGLLRDDNGRPYKSTRRGRLFFHGDGPALTDVWETPFLSTVASERTGYPTQKPLALLTRMIASATKPGDRVADFFCGSGTTLAAAVRLGRRPLGCDIAPDAVRITQARLGGPSSC